MRTLEYLSPSALADWESSRETFYVNRLADDRPEREPQTEPMSVGSAFDSYVKSYLHNALFGHCVQFELDSLIETTVEPHLRDFAIREGRVAFDLYSATGALGELLCHLQSSVVDPRFEFTLGASRDPQVASRDPQVALVAVEGRPGCYTGQIGGVTLLGKPDCDFTITDGDGVQVHVVLDWKVNGWCSRHHKSPAPGYVRLRQQRIGVESDCYVTMKSHKDSMVLYRGTFPYNALCRFENVNVGWASQLCTYGWLLGYTEAIDTEALDTEALDTEAIDTVNSVNSDDLLFAVDQICNRDRVAEHRCVASASFQKSLYQRYVDCWTAVQSGYIFPEMSREDSDARCAVLDQRHQVRYDVDDPIEAFLKRSSAKRPW